MTVKGFYAVEGYRYKDAAELKAAAKPLEGVGLAWVDADGYIKPIKDVVTDEDGQATFTVGSEATGYLVAQSGGDVYALMNPSDYIRKVAGKPVKTLGLTIRSGGQRLSAEHQRSAGGQQYRREVRLHRQGGGRFCAGCAGGRSRDGLRRQVYPATAKQYLAINPNNDWESKSLAVRPASTASISTATSPPMRQALPGPR